MRGDKGVDQSSKRSCVANVALRFEQSLRVEEWIMRCTKVCNSHLISLSSLWTRSKLKKGKERSLHVRFTLWVIILQNYRRGRNYSCKYRRAQNLVAHGVRKICSCHVSWDDEFVSFLRIVATIVIKYYYRHIGSRNLINVDIITFRSSFYLSNVEHPAAT